VSDASVGVVVVTHGQLATELLNAAEMIVGDLPRFAAVSIGWHDDVTVAREQIGRAIERVQTGTGVLILTDLFGGTPSNMGLSFLETGVVEVVTGVNLPMLIKLARSPERFDLLALAREVCDDARAAIRVASDLIRSHRASDSAGDEG
jgi:mannose PTS system EIIA component